MAAASDPNRVPLRRLSTKRFKTLAARRNDNARRRAKYALAKHAGSFPGISWDDAREAHDDTGMSWTALDDVIRERDRLAKLYDAGLSTGSDGMRLWRRVREAHLPDAFGYYHGIFG